MNTITLGFLLVALLLMLMGLSSSDWVHQQITIPDADQKAASSMGIKNPKVEGAVGLFDTCLFGSVDDIKGLNIGALAGGVCGDTHAVIDKMSDQDSKQLEQKLNACKGLLIAAISMLLVGLVAIVAFPAHPWVGALCGLIATVLAAACVMVFGIALKNKLEIPNQSKPDVYGSGFYLVIVGICLAGLGSMFSLGMEAKEWLAHRNKPRSSSHSSQRTPTPRFF
jgi:hypothetical protein